jgi:tetratricopeptide (TPR) repeat protein/predicted Ser/Thr protein kinase
MEIMVPTQSSVTNCPSVDALRQFVLHGKAASSSIESHLESCDVCQEAVEKIQSEQRLSHVGTLFRDRPLRDTNLAFLRIGDSAKSESSAPVRELPTIPGIEIEGFLGRGGMGVVYLARQTSLARQVAMKTIRLDHGSDTDFVTRFKREAQAVAALSHENIVRAYEFDEHEGLPYLLMEHVPGRTLHEVIRDTELTTRQAAELVIILACAIDYAHGKGVVHRDLKPANVLVTPDGTPKITDFGLARLRQGVAGQESLPGRVGTPCYMAPEQATGSQDVGPAADIYALGAILYELLCRRPPFAGDDIADILSRVQFEDPVSPRTLSPRLPLDLETICLKCLTKEPTNRYPTALALAEDLQSFLESRPIKARPPGLLDRATKFARRHRIVAGFLCLLTISSVVTAAMAFAANTQRRRAEEALASASVNLGQFHAAMGDWNEALKDFDNALSRSSSRAGETHLDVARVSVQLLKHTVAEEHLKRAEDIFGANDPRVLLARADASKDSVQARSLAARAIEAGKLPDIDIDYARGLAANTAAEALTHLRKATSERPQNVRAQRMLCSLLLLRHEFAEARDHAMAIKAFLPHDKTYAILVALDTALNGDQAAAEEQLRKASGSIEPETLDNFRKVYAYVAQMPRLDVDINGNPPEPFQDPITSAAALLKNSSVLNDISGGYAPPDMLEAYGKLQQLVFNSFVPPNPAQTKAKLEEILSIYRDGFFLFWVAKFTALTGDRLAAAKLFEEAARTPAPMDVRAASHFLAVRNALQLIMAGLATDELYPELERIITENTKSLLALGERRGGHLFWCSQAALRVNQCPLMLDIANAWQAGDPHSSGPDLVRAIAAHFTKRPFEAIESARRVLKAEDGGAPEFRSAGINPSGEARAIISNAQKALAESGVKLEISDD